MHPILDMEWEGFDARFEKTFKEGDGQPGGFSRRRDAGPELLVVADEDQLAGAVGDRDQGTWFRHLEQEEEVVDLTGPHLEFLSLTKLCEGPLTIVQRVKVSIDLLMHQRSKKSFKGAICESNCETNVRWRPLTENELCCKDRSTFVGETTEPLLLSVSMPRSITRLFDRGKTVILMHSSADSE